MPLYRLRVFVWGSVVIMSLASKKETSKKSSSALVVSKRCNPKKTGYLLRRKQGNAGIDLLFYSDFIWVSVLFFGGDVLQKMIAAIGDEEELYCDQLTAYLQGHQRKYLETRVYSERAKLAQALEEENVKIVLMTGDFFCKEILEHTGVVFVLLCEDEIPEEYSSYPRIYKYQQVEQILRELERLAGEEFEEEGQFHARKGGKITAFFSPAQDNMQMYTALGYAKLMAETEKVLYINLMGCAGFEELFSEEYQETFGDFLFYLRQNAKNLKLRFEGMIYRFGKVDYIPPVFFGEILAEAKEDDYKAFFRWLVTETDYERIVVDFGSMVQGFFHLLQGCDKIYCLSREDFVTKSRVKQFMQCVAEYDDENFLGKIDMLSLSHLCVPSSGKQDFMQELEWGEFGTYLRTRFEGEQRFAGTSE